VLGLLVLEKFVFTHARNSGGVEQARVLGHVQGISLEAELNEDHSIFDNI
jgi:hypothetical protein